MEAVAQANQGQADDVVAHELLVILARLLHSQDEDDGLLGPVGSLEEVVELDNAFVGAVREPLVHAARVEVPDRRAAHDVHASRPQDAKVKGGIHLFHEAGLLPLAEAGFAGKRAQHLLHDELAGERQDDGVEGDKGNVPLALAILDGLERIVLGNRVRQEEKVVQRISFRWVDGVAGQEDEKQAGGQNKGVLDHGLSKLRKESTSTAALRKLGRAGPTDSAGRQRRRTSVTGTNLPPEATALTPAPRDVDVSTVQLIC
ncbi:hypothetical protein Trco_006839 [Trichoderma cornu-damae]|uniref:Uncharacterized protein n=1 Tax=Trichoderma cornu-damae TaxID=654480 RepID=A0A9P8QMB0_9HYPO|nr:hypothetical protein Trco_006839 [Trichoderma cornu-damae]